MSAKPSQDLLDRSGFYWIKAANLRYCENLRLRFQAEPNRRISGRGHEVLVMSMTGRNWFS
jgi:hypothetical protein